MAATQCLGRLVRDTPKGVYCLPFEDGSGYFHVPLRCEKIAKTGDLCETCLERERRTLEKVAEMKGRSLQGTHPSYLHGRVNGPIPFWSHVYEGSWFRLKMESGCRISDETMAKARKAAAVVGVGVPSVDPEPIPVGGKGGRGRGVGAGGGRKPKEAPQVQAQLAFPKVSPEEAAAAATAAAAAVAAAEVPPVPAAPTPSPTKRGPKRAGGSSSAVVPMDLGPPTAIVRPSVMPDEVDNIVYVDVRKTCIDGRTLYLDPKKQKLYDLKYNYIGRYDSSSQRIDKTFPDSDAEN